MSTPDELYLSMLVDMGFSSPRAKKALLATDNKGVEPAMDWLLSHPEDVDDSNTPSTAPVNESNSVASPAEDNPSDNAADTDCDKQDPGDAKSLKCDVCGKLFKSSLEVEYHATKSGHDSFSESLEEKKPLSDEEKREKLRQLEEKMKQKRIEREQNEKHEAIQKEKFRIKSGKEMGEARKKMEELEMKKLLEQRKREKEEDRLARQAIREKIEGDKAARRAKAAAERGESIPVTPPVTLPPPSTVIAPKRDYTETRLQIRLTNGDTLTQNFGAKEQLSAVRLFIEMNRTDPLGPFNLLTTFPKKVFSNDDYDAPLDILGLVPSAVVIVQKKVE